MSFSPDDGSDGSAVCFNFENGAPEGQKIENHYLIFNTIYDAEIGLRSEYDGYVYCNLFYDIEQSAVRINGNSLEFLYVVNNSVYNAGYGIYHSRGTMFYAYNNLIVNPVLGHIKYQTGGNREIKNNVFFSSDSLLHLWVGGSGAQETRGLGNVSSNSNISDCFEGISDLLSTDSSNPYFLKSDKIGICVNNGESSGRVKEVVEDFDEVFGLNIAFDILSNKRPSTEQWDIGAYENNDPTGVTTNQHMSDKFTLSQNYPNPFNPKTVISYSVPAVGTSFMKSISLKIYDILGREIAVLVNEMKNAGDYTVEWDGISSSGQKVGSGIYFYQLKTSSGFTNTKKMLLLK